MYSRPVPKNDRKTSIQRHLIGFGAVLTLAVLLIVMIVNSFHASQSRKEAEGWRMHTVQVLLTAEKVRAAVNEALRGERGYLITSDPRFLQTYRHGRDTAPRLAARLQSLTSDNQGQHGNTAALIAKITRYVIILDRTVALTASGRTDDANAIVRNGVDRGEIESLLAILDRIEGQERGLLDIRQASYERATQAMENTDFYQAILALVFVLITGATGVGASRARLHALDMQAQLRRAATTDELTGLTNRRAFLEAFDLELARVARNGSPLSVAIVDLDSFKSVNDRFGHQGGDEVLRGFAKALCGSARATDIVARLGGDEFAVLMPNTGYVEAGIAAERLRNAIAHRRITLDSSVLVPVTASIGAARLNPGEARDGLLVRADGALYQAKDGGRNRTRLAA